MGEATIQLAFHYCCDAGFKFQPVQYSIGDRGKKTLIIELEERIWFLLSSVSNIDYDMFQHNLIRQRTLRLVAFSLAVIFRKKAWQGQAMIRWLCKMKPKLVNIIILKIWGAFQHLKIKLP